MWHMWNDMFCQEKTRNCEIPWAALPYWTQKFAQSNVKLLLLVTGRWYANRWRFWRLVPTRFFQVFLKENMVSCILISNEGVLLAVNTHTHVYIYIYILILILKYIIYAHIENAYILLLLLLLLLVIISYYY